MRLFVHNLLAAALVLLACSSACSAELGGELRLLGDRRQANDTAVSDLELHGTWRPQPAFSLSASSWLEVRHAEGGRTQRQARFNELQASADLAAWQLSAGKKVVAWDVGQGFRPNDLVQQEERRPLLATASEGRALLQAEHFGAESAAALVWANPQRHNAPLDEQRFGQESAWAARVYQRAGAADWHGFARLGRHTGASVGAALAWVAGDALELHASARLLQCHDGWRFDSTAGTHPVAAPPWQVATLGGASQWLLGATWTGAQQQSLIVEAWHDGSAPADDQWDRWQARNTALRTLPASAATAANLAWQAAPLAGSSLRRDAVFVRLAWQPERWQVWADALATPADAGRVLGIGAQWQGEHWRLTAVWRQYGGPAQAVLAQLPQRRAGVLAAAWAW